MLVGILGQPCIDEIVQPGMRLDRPTQALGGVLYSYAAMERLMRTYGSQNDTFVPLTWFSEPDAELLGPLVGSFEHLDRSEGFWPTNIPSNRVQLVYEKNGHRNEHCPHILPALTAQELTPALIERLDALFVNMISGFDVSLGTLETALSKTKKRPYVHLDVHALVLGPLSDRNASAPFGAGRQPRGVLEWRTWLRLADSVQMNEFEARWLADPEFRSEEDLLSAIRQLPHDERPSQIIMTRASRGSSIYLLDKGEVHDVMAPEIQAIETTGSGDVFGAAYVFFIMRGYEPRHALEQSVRWASWNTTLKSIHELLDSPIEIQETQ